MRALECVQYSRNAPLLENFDDATAIIAHPVYTFLRADLSLGAR